MARSALVVDDSASMRHLVTQTLRSLGFETHEAENGSAALGKVREVGAVDLVVTDLNMPVMDGITLVKKLRELATFKYTPVLILTTETRGDYKTLAKQAGATGWLVKPFEPSQLSAVVKRVLP
jgi:two-component system chemotaxis response regulator CheY